MRSIECTFTNEFDGVRHRVVRSSPNSVFKVTAFLKSNISKMVRFRDNVTKEH